jgi:ribonuclease E
MSDSPDPTSLAGSLPTAPMPTVPTPTAPTSSSTSTPPLSVSGQTDRGSSPDSGPVSKSPTGASSDPSEADEVGGDPANRRRGSRGGRKRRSGSGSASGLIATSGSSNDDSSRFVPSPDSSRFVPSSDSAEYDRRPADLPDSPFEGVPSPEAAARAEVRPRIGDSRPAIRIPVPPVTVSDRTQDGDAGDEAVETDTPRSGNTRKGRRGGRSKSGRTDAERSTESGELTPRGPRPSRSERIAAALDDDRVEGTETPQVQGETRNPRQTSPKREKPAPRSGLGTGLERSGLGTGLERSGLGTNQGESSTDTSSEDGPRKGRRGGNTPKNRGRGNSHAAELIERPRGRERNGRPVGRFLMCVHAHPKATQIAVLEGRSLIEHYVSRPTDNANQIHGNIYLGRVQNVLPGMEAAFVDIGTPKNAVVYRGDLQFDAGDIESSGKKKDDVRIEQVLKNRQLVLCQVTKNPIGSKGARLTQDVSIPGRFVVLVPNSDTYGISKRLGDDERKRLRRILDEIRPEKHGLIVRTAAEGATPDELQRDVALLLRQWEAIEAKAKKANSPMLLHKEPDMAVRVIREEFNQNYRGIVIDDRELYEEVRSYVESISPELADRVEFHDSSIEPLPLFEKHHVHEQLHKAIDRKVWLPSGGSLIIERTEALTVIDVNTGKNVGSSSLEETVFRNNLEAADEIARQLRLRDIGGIVVIDFIDMEIRANREAVIGTFRDALSRDKTRTQVFDISELGLVEMTRKRISEGLVESLSEGCPTCAGRGFTFDSDLID